MATFFKGEGRHGKSKFNSGITELFGESPHSEDLKYLFVNVTLGNFQELFNAVDRLLDEREASFCLPNIILLLCM